MGFLLGIKHAAEADHVAAVATLASGQVSLTHTLRQGIAWGVGHTLTLMLFGGVMLALGNAIPAGMAQALELVVAIMLIALGIDVLRRLLRQKIHVHVHDHAQAIRHVHVQSHATTESVSAQKRVTAALEMQPHDHRHGLPLRALAVGMMHGMAGTAALILLSLDAVKLVQTGLVYIALFGVGSTAGMALLSVAIAVPLRLTAARGLGWLHQGITGALGAFSGALGALMVCQIALV